MKEKYGGVNIRGMIHQSGRAVESLYEQVEELYAISELIYQRFTEGNKVLTFGNGGSAADAQHIAGELVGKFKKERRGLPAIALTTNTSVLTSWSNDKGYDGVFERQVEAHANQGDVLWGISTSGNSQNVNRAFRRGKENGTYNVSLTGREGGLLKTISDFNVNIPLDDTPRIQEAHMLAYHIICELVEKKVAESE